MERQIFPKRSEALKYFQIGVPAKFIIIQEEDVDDTKTRVIFFRFNHDHSAIVRTALETSSNGVFIGAGSIEDKRCYWGSETCLRDIGIDRPDEQEVQEKLLRVVNEHFFELLQEEE
jgi:hypothetical protein